MNYFLVTIEFIPSDNRVVNLTTAFATYKAFVTQNDIILSAENSGYKILTNDFSIRFLYKMTKKQYDIWVNSAL